MVTCIRNVRSGQRIPKRKVTETKGKDDNKEKIAGELDLLNHHGKVRNFVSEDRQGFWFHSIFLALSLQRVHCFPNSCLVPSGC